MSKPVELRFSGNSDDAMRAIAALERKYESLEQKIKRGAEQQRTALKRAFDTRDVDAFSNRVGGVISKMGMMVSVVGTARMAWRAMSSEAFNFNKTVSETFDKINKEELKLRVQGGFTPAEVEKQIPAIRRANLATPVMSAAEAIMTQKELAGAGFSRKDIDSGQAMSVMSQLQAVTNQYGREMGSAKETVLPVSQLLKGLGNAQPGAVDIKRVGAKLTTLMAESDIQFGHLAQLSQEASTLKQYGLSESEQLAAFSWLSDIQGPEMAGTGLRLFTTRTATMSTDKVNVNALRKIGLKPSDISIAPGGVTMDQAVDRLRGATKDMSAEEKNTLFKTLYGEKGQNAAAVMLSDEGMETIRRRRKMADNAQGEFQAKLDAYEGSRQAVVARERLQKEWMTREEGGKGMTWQEYRDTLDSRAARIRAAQDNPASRRTTDLGTGIGKAGLWGAEGLGFSPTDMGAPTGAELIEIGKKQLEEIKAMRAEMEKQNNDNRPPLNRNGQN